MDQETIGEFGFAIITAVIGMIIVSGILLAVLPVELSSVIGDTVPATEAVDYKSNSAMLEYFQLIAGGNK